MIELKIPEAATVVRWVLRLTLVVFLLWLARRKTENDDEDGEDDDDTDDRKGKGKGFGKGSRMPGRTSPANAQLRNRVQQGRGDGLSQNFDDVIARMSKPKNMWEAQKGGTPQILKQPPAPAAVAPSGRAAVLPGSRSPAAQAKRTKENVFHGHERPVTFITLNRDGNLLFTCGKDKLVLVWSFPDGDCLGKYQGHNGALWACSVTRDSKWLVTCGADRLVIVWEARTSLQLTKVELPGVAKFVEWAGGMGEGETAETEKFVTCHNRFAKNPASLTVWTFDGTEATKGLDISLENCSGVPNQVRWGKDDATLVSCHDNGEIIFWSSTDGSKQRQLQAHEASLSKFDFSTDRSILATCSVDMSVKLWDLSLGNDEPIFSIKSDRPLNGVSLRPMSREQFLKRPPTMECCAIAGGGQDPRDVAISGSTSEQFETLCYSLGSGTAPEQGVAALEVLTAMKGHFGPIHTLTWSSDGSAFASGSEDGCVRVHFTASVSSDYAASATASNGNSASDKTVPEEPAAGDASES